MIPSPNSRAEGIPVAQRSLRSLCRRAETLRRVARGFRAALIAAGAAGVAGTLAVIALRCFGRTWPLPLAVGLPVAGALLGAIWSLLYQSRSLADAALALEERYGLKTLLTTALAIEGVPVSGGGPSAFTRAILSDAETRAHGLSPASIVEWNLRRPASFAFGGILMLSATTLYFPELDLFDRRETVEVEERQRDRRREEARRLEDLARKLDAPMAETPLDAASEQDIATDLERLADSLRDPKLGREDAMLRVSDLEQKVKAEREALEAKEPELNAMALKDLKTDEARSLALSIMNRDFAGASAQAAGLAESLRSGAMAEEREEAIGSDLKRLAESLQGNAEVAENLDAAGESLEAGLSGAGAEHLDTLAESLDNLARSAEAGRALAAASEALDRTRQALGDASGSGSRESGGQGAAGSAGEGDESSTGESPEGAAGQGSQTGAQQGAGSQQAGTGAEAGSGAQGSPAGQGSSGAGEQGAQGAAGSQSGGESQGSNAGSGQSGTSGQSGASGQPGASGASGQPGQSGQSGQNPSGGSSGGQQAGSSGSPSGGGSPGAGQQGTQPDQGGSPGGGQGQQQQQGGGWGATPPPGASQGDGGQQGGQSGQQGGQSGGQSGQSGQSGGQQGGGGAQPGQAGAAAASGGGQASSGSAGAAGGQSGSGGAGGPTDWGVGSTNLEQGEGGRPTGGEQGGRQAAGEKSGWEERFMSLYRERSIEAQNIDGQVQGQYGEGEELGWRSVDGEVERRAPTALQGDLFTETRIREKQSLDQQDIPFEYKDSVRRYFDSIEVPNR